VRAVTAADEGQLAEVPGIGPTLAAAISDHLRSQRERAVPAVNLSTGEVVTTDPPGNEGRTP